MKPTAYYERRIVELETEVERLTQIAEADKNLRAPLCWKLTPTENSVLCKLATREMPTREALMLTAQCNTEVLRVIIYRLRHKLAGTGYAIRNIHGSGYAISNRRQLMKELVRA